MPTFPSGASLHSSAAIGARVSVFLSGFSVTILVLILSASTSEMTGLGHIAAIALLILTVGYLVFATECFLRLPQGRSRSEVKYWAGVGSLLYGLGTAALVAALAIIIHLFTSNFGTLYIVLPYLLIVFFMAGWITYGATRLWWVNSQKRPEGWWKALISRRPIMMFAHPIAAAAIVFLMRNGLM